MDSIKEYLGDSVYAEAFSEAGMVKLTTENEHNKPSNIIYLDDTVITALLNFLQAHCGYDFG